MNHNSPSATKVNRLHAETDVLISFTQIKMHEEATVALGIKNIAHAEVHGFWGLDLRRSIRGFGERNQLTWSESLTWLAKGSDQAYLARYPSKRR